MKKYVELWKEYPGHTRGERVQHIYLVWHAYKNQPTGFGVERAFTRQEDALAYIKKDPNIGVEKEFMLQDQYGITVVDLVDFQQEVTEK
jgi:hypothetical protein